MRALVERVASARVVVGGAAVGQIERGLLVYLGVEAGDADTDLSYVVDKVRNLRIFPDDAGKMNRDVGQAGGAVLVVSAFSVAADAREGRRPAFDRAARAEIAEPMYEAFCRRLREAGLVVQTGRFRAMMRVEAVNDGPICILLDSKKTF